MNLDKVSGLEREHEDGLYCPECLPSCSDTTYMVSSMRLPLIPTNRNYPTLMYVYVLLRTKKSSATP